MSIVFHESQRKLDQLFFHTSSKTVRNVLQYFRAGYPSEMEKTDNEELLREREKKDREEATARILRLIEAMAAAGENDQIPRLSQEPDFLAAMLDKYHL